MSEWDITTEEGWSDKLGKLLEEADTVGDAVADRKALSRRFVQFILRSRPNTEAIKALDVIANEARRSVLISAIDDRVAAISDRTAELVLLTKGIEETTANAEKAAQSIRLENAQGAVDGLAQSVKSIKALAASMKDADDEQVRTSLENALKTLINLKKKVQAVADAV